MNYSIFILVSIKKFESNIEILIFKDVQDILLSEESKPQEIVSTMTLFV